MADTYTLNHPVLGPLTGKILSGNVVQFSGVPYATIPARFKRSIMLEKLPGNSTDYTTPGFACPHKYDGDDIYGGGAIPGEPSEYPMDEFKCLILQIHVPLALLQSKSKSKLPILFYIHGGGFKEGKIDLVHSTHLQIAQSITDSKPVIGVSIQYRLGALGFMTTPEEKSSNLGMWDQRNALIWVQKFIGGFGGDEKKITAFGESAGSMSISLHMLSDPPKSGPLFQRAILQSGVLGLMSSPKSATAAKTQYQNVLKLLGITGSEEEALKKLREVGMPELLQASETVVSGAAGLWGVAQDSEWFGEKRGIVDWTNMAKLLGECDWVKEVIIGDTGFEGQAYYSVIKDYTPALLLGAISQQIGASAAASIAKIYNISTGMDLNKFYSIGMLWYGDVVFDAPTHDLAKHLSTSSKMKVYRYIFDVGNPFPGSKMYQQSHHWVDVYFMFKTFEFRFAKERLKDISTQHARMWTGFANGKAPWKEYKYADGKDAIIFVADQQEGWVKRTVGEDEKLNERSWDRCEALYQAWGQTGPAKRDLTIADMKPSQQQEIV
ncbi:alpha/beta-hydrolase [Amniculicola lignicola CBS 123094]|uniref:Alpha/beta-hydrolase n=1 Tax=Amniculicola lignicola CBS 123094 TaxID=1392246 RepID=A0A6A5WTQ0_9PLEO|nr:alpha/beta-hydrolase [Amniculicola lignicola CBS 123094]